MKFDPNQTASAGGEGGWSDFQSTPGVRTLSRASIPVNPLCCEIKTSFPDSLQGKTVAVSVSGLRTLALVQFKALQTGSTASISVQYPVLVDQSGARVPVTSSLPSQ